MGRKYNMLTFTGNPGKVYPKVGLHLWRWLRQRALMPVLALHLIIQQENSLCLSF